MTHPLPSSSSSSSLPDPSTTSGDVPFLRKLTPSPPLLVSSLSTDTQVTPLYRDVRKGEAVGEEQLQKATVMGEIKPGRQPIIDHEGGMGKEGHGEEEGDEGLPPYIQCTQHCNSPPSTPLSPSEADILLMELESAHPDTTLTFRRFASSFCATFSSALRFFVAAFFSSLLCFAAACASSFLFSFASSFSFCLTSCSSNA
jgi:hypothetical protein